MPALNAKAAPNSTRSIETTIQDIRKAIQALNDKKCKKGKQAFRNLGNHIEVLQHSLDHPGEELPEFHKNCTRKFLRKANLAFQKHAARLGHIQPVRSAEGKKKTKPGKKAVPKPTSNNTTAEIVDLTGGTSDEDAQRPSPEADVRPSSLWFFDSSAAPATISCQPEETDNVPGQSTEVASYSKEVVKVGGGLQASAAGQEQSGTTTSATLVSELRETKMSAREGSHSNIRGGVVNETDILEDVQALAKEQENISSPQEASLDDMLEAAVNCRDYELWYDPTADFDEDLLP